MKYHDPLKKILSQARPYWDRDEIPAGVRGVFGKALQCRTAELGAEVYASEKQVCASFIIVFQMVGAPKFATARSSLWSPLKSATAAAAGKEVT